MKKLSAVILALTISLSFSACEEKPEELHEPAETTAVSEVVTTAPETPAQISSETEEKINAVIDYIFENEIKYGCFCDFTGDDFPELVELFRNPYDDSRKLEYYVYDIKSDKPNFYGAISADVAENITPLTLYKSKKTGQYFYLENDIRFDHNYIKISSAQILDTTIVKRTLAIYNYEPLEDGKIRLTAPGSFMGNVVLPEKGEYLHAEMNKLLGVDDYISENFDKVGEVSELTASWGILDEYAKEKIREELISLLGDYKKAEESKYAPPEELKALFQSEELIQEFNSGSIWSISIKEAFGESCLIVDHGGAMGSDYCSVYSISTGKKLGEHEGFPFYVYNDNGRQRCIANAWTGGSSGGNEDYYEIILTEDKLEAVPLFGYECRKDYNTFEYNYKYYVGENPASEEKYNSALEYILNLSRPEENKIITYSPYYFPRYSSKEICEMVYGLMYN